MVRYLSKSFEMFKKEFCKLPILIYPDANARYTVFTDASRHGWAGILTQRNTSVANSKLVILDYPITYVSGLFKGSQVNWAALTKEAYAIYMLVKKAMFLSH